MAILWSDSNRQRRRGKPVRREITVLENVLKAGVQTPRFVGGMWVSRPPQAAVHPQIVGEGM